MWRLNRLHNSSILSHLKEVSSKQRESVISLSSSSKFQQAGKPAAKPAIGNNYIDKFSEGQEVEGFVVQEVGHIPEYHLTAIRLQHEKTGAQYLHIDRADSNNAFGIHFRTPPLNSTGVPHILEHTTLCGSERFPVRDPFFKMLHRSIATHLNAYTGADFTCYPFATQNRQDYNNLLSVYLDSVFRPKLRELDFKQEGWRLENQDVLDKTSPVTIKGVVFNEMKGVYSNNTNIFYKRMLNSLLPSHTYGVDSGGDPLVIPSLTHQDLVAFHRKHYQPSNAVFYSYGNFPLHEHLKYLSTSYLSGGKRQLVNSAVPAEPRWKSERREHYSYRPDPMAADPKKQSSLCISTLATEITNIQEVFELQIISELLVDGANSSFYSTLIEPNIGDSFHPVTGYSAHTKDTFFSVGLQGMDSADFDKVVEIIDKTLLDVVDKGFEQKRVEEVLHRIELGMKHQAANFGLTLLLGLSSYITHDCDLLHCLRQAQQVAKLQENLKNNPRYLQDKVKQYLVGNPHRLILSMSPDQYYEENQTKLEAEILEKKVKVLTDEQKEKIYNQGLELLAEQEKQEDVSVLPFLKVSDIKNEIERHKLDVIKETHIPVQYANQPTNGVTYLRGILNVSHLSEEQKKLFPLFCKIVTQMGTKDHDFRQFDHLVEMKTGGLGVASQTISHPSQENKFEEALLFSSHCLDRNLEDMLSLWDKVFNTIKMENVDRFKTLLNATAAGKVSSVTNSGHRYAMLGSAGLISPISRHLEATSGLPYISFIRKLSEEKELGPILEQLQEIWGVALTKRNARLSVNAMPESRQDIERQVKSFLDVLPGEERGEPVVWSSANPLAVSGQPGVHYCFPLPVNFVSKSVEAVPYTHPDFSALQVLSRLLFKYLHPNIREKGGAYGSGSVVSGTGVFSFFSYRDPNPNRTLDIFDGSYDWVAENNFTDLFVEEAKLGVLQGIDAPVPPGDRGSSNFINHISYDMLQENKTRVKTVTRQQLLDVNEKYLKPREGQKCGRALIGPENPQLSSRSGESWTTITQ